jgi:uncharacterized membrane protein
VLVAQSWQGPLPPPEILQGYEDAFPGAAERIFKMAEDQGEHRRELEKQAFGIEKEGMVRSFAEARLGQILAFAISALFLGCGTYTAIHGQAVVGSLFGTLGIGGIVTTFIEGRKKTQSEGKQEPVPKESESSKRKRPRR